MASKAKEPPMAAECRTQFKTPVSAVAQDVEAREESTSITSTTSTTSTPSALTSDPPQMPADRDRAAEQAAQRPARDAGDDAPLAEEPRLHQRARDARVRETRQPTRQPPAD